MKQHSKHLTDENFATLLANTGTAPDEQSAEVTAVRTALQSYRAETLQWAERKSSTQVSLLPAARRHARWAALPQWSMAVVAVITIAAGVAHLAENRPAMQDTTATTVPAEARALSSDIAADNRLLSSIDAALSYHANSPVDALALTQQEPSTGSRAAGETD